MQSRRRKMQRSQRVPVGVLNIAVSLMLFFGVVLYNQVMAQTFGKPPTPAPNNAGLNTFTDDSDFVKLNNTSPQEVKGNLIIASSTAASAFLGDFTNAVSVTGVAGTTVMPPDLPSTVPGSALYGYATGILTSAGAYGSASGINSAGVVGETRDLGQAGNFFGPVTITSSGSLTASGTISAIKLDSTSAVFSVPAIYSMNGISASGLFSLGLNATGDKNYGLYGRSSTTVGLYAVNTADTWTNPPDVFGIRGETYSITGAAGLFGYSTKGNGVSAQNGSVSVIPAAQGVVTGLLRAGPPTDYSAAVYGRGGAFAGYFEGDVRIQNGLLYINKTGITEAVLIKLLEWTCGTPASAPSNPNCDPYGP